MLAGWRGYFEWFPDYRIEVSEVFPGEITADSQNFALLGFAEGSFKGNADASWRLPAALKAVVQNGHIAAMASFCRYEDPV